MIITHSVVFNKEWEMRKISIDFFLPLSMHWDFWYVSRYSVLSSQLNLFVIECSRVECIPSNHWMISFVLLQPNNHHCWHAGAYGSAWGLCCPTYRLLIKDHKWEKDNLTFKSNQKKGLLGLTFTLMTFLEKISNFNFPELLFKMKCWPLH